MAIPHHRNRCVVPFLAVIMSAIACTIASAALPQDAVILRYRNRESRLAAYQKDGLWYVSLEELAQRLSFPVIPAAAARKIECIVGKTRLKFTADNPFVVMIDHASNTIDAVYHMPCDVEQRGTTHFAPLPHLAILLRTVWLHTLSYDAAVPALSVDAAVPAPRPMTTLSPIKVTVSDSLPARRQPAAVDSSGPGRGGTGNPATETQSRLAPREAQLQKESRFDISHVSIDARRNGTLLRIHSARELHGFHKDRNEGLFRISIPDATVDIEEIRQTPIGGGDVRSVRATQVNGEAVIELELGEAVTTQMLAKDVESHDLLVTLYRSADVEQVFQDEEQDKKPKKQDRKRTKWNLDCIVIDPGHGGKDPGAIGVNGVKEKNVTLGIALKLGDMIESSMKDVKVVYTRKDDRFIELDRRGRIANEAEGKLFISIHCNSTEEKPTTAHGAEVYLLRPGRTAEAIRVAEFENSVVKFEKDYQKRYKELTDENFIIVTMAQSAYMKYSERFAELFHLEVKASKKLRSLGVKQAGFYVLVGASMPSVLVETGFISNIREEAFLASQAGQKHVATLILDAIVTFAREYQKSLRE